MKQLKTIFLTLMVALLIPMAAYAWDVPKENLTYDIMYKWGLVNKKTGTVSVRTETPRNGRFNSRLTATTAPWVDHLYRLRDTLRGNIDSRRFIPYTYEKIAFEDGHNEHDNITYTHTASGTDAKVVHRLKRKKEKEMTTTYKDMHGQGLTFDMLSAFYYMRTLDYASMKKGETVKVNIFSGSKAEILTIHFDGVEKIDFRNRKVDTFHVTFTFTSEAGKKSSDSMDAWLSTTDGRIPLLMEGKLPVGKVRAVYSGKF